MATATVGTAAAGAVVVPMPPGGLWNDLDIGVIVGSGEFSSGKAQPLDAKVLTPEGWRQMGELRIGDLIVDPDGGAAKVTGIFPQGRKPISRVVFTDGAATECCDDHLWHVKTNNDKNRGNNGRVMSLRDIRDEAARVGTIKHWIPLCNPVRFADSQMLEIDPYLLGVILGDGCLVQGSVTVTTPEEWIVDRVGELLPAGLSPRREGDSITYRLAAPRSGIQNNPLIASLRSFGLKGKGNEGKKSVDKFIPECYLKASPWDRLALLQGLCDTDGYAGNSWCEYSSSSKVMAEQVLDVARSLGGTANIRVKIPFYTYKGEKRTGCTSYTVHIKLPDGMCPFSLPRKVEAYGSSHVRGPTRRIVSIAPAGEKECQCIMVDSVNHTYITDDYIVTHNTIFGLSIDPGPRTLVMDNEGSSLTYKSFGFEHIDMAEELAKKYPNGYSPTNRYFHWKERAIEKGKKGGKAGKYTVLQIDPFSEIESGLEEYIRNNLEKFNLTAKMLENMSGVFWGKMKDQLQADLDSLRPYYETIYLTVHMRDEFKNKARTGKREAKGKDTLWQLASLFLEFERKPNPKGEVPDVPSAIVKKSRLAVPKLDANGLMELNSDGDIVLSPVLPPRMPKATPGMIRKFIKTPPDYSKLKKDELAPEKEPSEMDKLAVQAQIAESNATAETASLTRVQMMTAAAERAAKQREMAAANSDKSGDAAAARSDRAADSAAFEASPIGDNRKEEILGLLEKFHGVGNVDAYRQDVKEIGGVATLSELTNLQADGYLSSLYGRIAAKKKADAEAKLAASAPTVPPVRPGATDAEPFNSDEPAKPSAKPELASAAQIKHLQELIVSLGIEPTDVATWHKKRKVGSFRSWKADDLAAVVAMLEADLNEQEAVKSQAGGETGASGTVYPAGN